MKEGVSSYRIPGVTFLLTHPLTHWKAIMWIVDFLAHSPTHSLESNHVELLEKNDELLATCRFAIERVIKRWSTERSSTHSF